MYKSEKFWDRTAKNFDQQDDHYDPSYIRTIKKYLRENDIVLDFACGTGTFSNIIAGSVKEIQAIDISSKMLEIAQRKADENRTENIKFGHLNIFDEGLEAGSFDIVLTFNILHLLENLPQAMQRINNLLKSGGYFISDTPCLGEHKTFRGILIALMSKLPIIPYFNDFSVSELNETIASNNFNIIENEILSNNPPTSLIVARKILEKP